MKPRHVRRVGLPHALALVVVLLATVVVGGASGATTAPTFARADYELFGNNYTLGDFNGDGSLDLAGAGGPPQACQMDQLFDELAPQYLTAGG